MTVYLSGPMTGLPDENHSAFNAAAGVLRSLGHVVLNPAENDAPVDEPTWQDWMRLGVAQVAQSDEVVLLPGWEKSKGARVERELAVGLGLPVRPIDVVLAGAFEPRVPGQERKDAGACKGCSRPFRPARAKAAAWPGTVPHAARGLCKKCIDDGARAYDRKVLPVLPVPPADDRLPTAVELVDALEDDQRARGADRCPVCTCKMLPARVGRHVFPDAAPRGEGGVCVDCALVVAGNAQADTAASSPAPDPEASQVSAASPAPVESEPVDEATLTAEPITEPVPEQPAQPGESDGVLLPECHECHGQMRPYRTTAKQFPGTKVKASLTECGACAARRRTREKHERKAASDRWKALHPADGSTSEAVDGEQEATDEGIPAGEPGEHAEPTTAAAPALGFRPGGILPSMVDAPAVAEQQAAPAPAPAPVPAQIPVPVLHVPALPECKQCQGRMRPPLADEDRRPGTVIRGRAGLCTDCYDEAFTTQKGA